MIELMVRDQHGRLDTDRPIDQLPQLRQEAGSLLWLRLTGIQTTEVERLLTDHFHFHPLAIDDALVESHIPKVDDWGDYLYIVLRAVRLTYDAEDRLLVPELDVFLGPNFMVTYCPEKLDAVETVWELCRRDARWTGRGAGFLLYRLIDELVTDCLTMVDRMQEELEVIEDQLFEQATPATLARLFTLKRNILQLRRVVVPQRDVLGRLARNGYATLTGDDQIFFRDVYDHLLQLDDLLDDLLILVGGAMDTYLSLVNNRMNDIVKTLTVITALFLPLAFVTGFFGMNFFQAGPALVTWTGFGAFLFVLGLMVVVPVVMVWWMRRRAWI